FIGVKAVVQNNAPTDGEQRSHEYGKAAGVVHGRVNLNPVTLPQLPRDHGIVRVPRDLAMRNHYALRSSCGAARIEQTENIFGLDFRRERIWAHNVNGVGVAQCLGCTTVRIQIDQVLEWQELLEFLRELFVSCGVHQTARPAIRENLLQFVSCATRSKRNENNAGLACRPKGIDVLNPVFREDADAISWNESADIGPHPRALQGPSIEFGVSDLPARGNVDQSDSVGTKTGALSENVAGNHEFSPD